MRKTKIACVQATPVIFDKAKTLAKAEKLIQEAAKEHGSKIKMNKIPFQTIDWTSIGKVEYKGETGTAYWQTIQFNGLRIRLVEYTNGYLADHWCQKGHIVHCLNGEFISELNTGEKIKLSKGGTYIVSDKLSSHRSISENGATLLIVDGDFLKID